MSRLAAVLIALVVLPLAGCQKRPGEHVELPVPHIPQETLLCVPTSAAMVLAYYGDPRAPRSLKALSRGKAYDPNGPFDDFTITYYADMRKGLANIGYAWSDKSFPDTPQGFADGLKVIQGELRQGRPVLVDISHDGVGHTVVVRGFDEGQRRLLFVDPAQPAPGAVSTSYDQFETLWNEHAYGGQFRALMRTARKMV